MPLNIDTLLAKINELESQLETELAARQAELKYRIEQGRIIFDESVTKHQKQFKEGLRSYLKGVRPMVVITAPIIYAVIIPLVLLDAFVSLYQAVCFPVYGITKVQRKDYIIFDRSQLAYLNIIEKLNCGYCSYGNGLIAYVREIVSRTEQYWCPIKHAHRLVGAHHRYANFIDYSDAEAYRTKLEELRGRLKEPPQ